MEEVLMQETMNIFDAGPIEGRVDLGALGESEKTAAYLYETATGEAMCPYHYEYVEEWMPVVTGEASVRTPGGDVLLGLWDTATAWMVQRGQPGQWGT
jgi:hypothetical protein